MRIGALATVLAGALAVGVSGGQEGKAPVPLEVPAAWELGFDYQTPRPITVRLPGEKKATVFWYLLYTVTNQYREPRTQQPTEQIFVPDFALYTNTGQLLRAGKKTPNVVYEAIKKRHNNPHLKDMVSITGKLLFGEDNAKDGVAIWKDFDPKAGSADIFVGGLSGEIIEIQLPKPVKVTRMDHTGKTTTEEVSMLRLTKTLQLTYNVPGEVKARAHTRVVFVGKRWVMR